MTVTGKGAHPFHSAWLLESNGEMPGRPILNLLLPGRLDDTPEEDLRAAYATGLESIKARNRARRRDQILPLMVQRAATEQADSEIMAAASALNALPRPPAPEFRTGSAAVTTWNAAREALRAACTDNPTWVSLQAQIATQHDALRRDDTIPEERDAKRASDELRRRGRPVT